MIYRFTDDSGAGFDFAFNFVVAIKDLTLIVYPSPGFSNAGLGF